MTELWNEIIKWENLIVEQQKRDLLAAIMAIMATIAGFPIPPNAPNPQTAPMPELEAYFALVQAAAQQFDEENQGGGG